MEIVDALTLNLSDAQSIERIVNWGPDVVGITIATGVHNAAVAIGEKIRAALPDVKIILGGPHPHFMFDSMMRSHEWIDFCCRGEGEETTYELLRALERDADLSSVKGLVYRRDGEPVANPDRPFVADLDSLPFPAWDLLPMEQYRWGGLYGYEPKDRPTATLAAMRGCPFQCHFCSSSYLYNIQRRRSVENVLDEISLLKERYNPGMLLFPNDFHLMNEKWATDFCKGMIERELHKIRWVCMGRPGAVSASVLDWAKKARLGVIMYGIEFGNQRLLDFSGKGTTISQIEATIAETRKRGILAMGFFIMGYPTETPETIEDTIRLAKRLKVDYAVFNMAKALPGAPLYDYCLEKGILITDSDECYTLSSMQQISLEKVSPEKLAKLYRKALKSTKYSLMGRLRKLKTRGRYIRG